MSTPEVSVSADAVEVAREGVANALHGDAYEGCDPAARREIDTTVDVAITAALPVLTRPLREFAEQMKTMPVQTPAALAMRLTAILDALPGGEQDA